MDPFLIAPDDLSIANQESIGQRIGARGYERTNAQIVTDEIGRCDVARQRDNQNGEG